ncbi:MAG: ABC transporter permease, partial [Candidatus Atribacteria bacterium]|nr:ABC transporter permease [Candidatus Atribacteria bacterium]
MAKIQQVSKIRQTSMAIQRFIVIGALIVLFAVFAMTTPKFFTLQNVLAIALQTSTLAFMGIGVT